MCGLTVTTRGNPAESMCDCFMNEANDKEQFICETDDLVFAFDTAESAYLSLHWFWFVKQNFCNMTPRDGDINIMNQLYPIGIKQHRKRRTSRPTERTLRIVLDVIKISFYVTKMDLTFAAAPKKCYVSQSNLPFYI